MERHEYTGETKQEAINKAKKDLEETENNLIINIKEDKDEKVVIEVLEKRELFEEIKSYIKELLEKVGYNTIKIELTNKNINPTFTIYSENDALLIGKNAKNVKALQSIVMHHINKELRENFKFVINVSDYEKKREKSLEHLAFNIAHEVRNSHIPVKLDRMNSYERRIIHNILKDDRYVKTHSEGEEPNRYVIIEPKEEK